jgi:hypothetical protein
VPERHAGTASGINNATSRIAAVLAVAVLGSLALFHFRAEIGARADSLQMPQAAVRQLQDEAAKLGEASVPPGVPRSERQAAAQLLRSSFVDTVQLMMRLCMALAAAGAVLSAILVGRGRRRAEAASVPPGRRP